MSDEILDGETLPEVVEPITPESSKELAAPVRITSDGFSIETIDELYRASTALAASKNCPSHLRGDPGGVMMMMMIGTELGLSAAQSLMQLNSIKGKVTLPAKVKLALIQASPLCAGYRYGYHGEGETRSAWVISERVGRKEANDIVEFSMAQAELAGLLRPSREGEPSNYLKYPDDMLLWKAVSRDADRNWGDVTLNLPTAEMVRVEGRAPRGLPEPSQDSDPLFALEGGE